jgi:hypothetical protein
VQLCTVGFVAAAERAELNPVSFPPRGTGKRLIVRILFLRMVLIPATLVATTVGSFCWILGVEPIRHHYRIPWNSNVRRHPTLLSEHFAYNSHLHPHIVHGNKLSCIFFAIVASLQLGLDCRFTLNQQNHFQRGLHPSEYQFWLYDLACDGD